MSEQLIDASGGAVAGQNHSAFALFGQSRTSRWIVVLLLILINGAVGWNAIRHDPRIGYDAHRHIDYAKALAKGRLPLPADTSQFYSPPLPYLFPAALTSSLHLDRLSSARMALLFQWGLSIALCVLVLAVSESISPGDDLAKIASLAFLGMPAVYYRTFAMLRGEPFVTFFTILLVLFLAKLLTRKRFSLSHVLGLALIWSALALSRQWGLVVVGASACFLILLGCVHRPRAGTLIGTSVVALLLTALFAGWFYMPALSDPQLAFNRKLSLEKRSHRFAKLQAPKYLGIGSAWSKILEEPARPNFHNNLTAILYADWWGDYHKYFLYHTPETSRLRACDIGWIGQAYRDGDPNHEARSNGASMHPYLGRINLFAILPTLILVCGVGLGFFALSRTVFWNQGSRRDTLLALLTTLAVATLLAHAAAALYLINPAGNQRQVLKASYDLQVLPLVALLGGQVITGLHKRYSTVAILLGALLVATWIHGYGAAFTRWPSPQPCHIPSWDAPHGANSR